MKKRKDIYGSLDKKGEGISFIRDKRGVQLSLETILMMILVVFAVSILFLFFSGNFKGLFEKITDFGSHSNVDSVVASCNLFVSNELSYSFCCEKREIKYVKEEDGEQVNKKDDFTCNELAGENSVLSEIIKKKLNKLNCEESC